MSSTNGMETGRGLYLLLMGVDMRLTAQYLQLVTSLEFCAERSEGAISLLMVTKQ